FGRVRGGARGRGGRAGLVLAAAAFPGLAFVALTHFARSGYVLAFLAPLVLLALLPASRVAGSGRVVVVAAVVVLAAFNAQRFLGAPGVVPLSLVDRPGLWVAGAHLGAPYPVTRAQIQEADENSRRYDQLRDVVDPATEVIVFDLGHAGGGYRHATYFLPEYRMHLTGGGLVWRTARARQQRFVEEGRIVVPPGGNVVAAMDAPFPDVAEMIRSGTASPIDLSGDRPVAVRVGPGETVFGLPVVEGRPGPYVP
ncbi:MAG: hypothetical protein ACRDY7_10535, partial [Acidimicrobiia bacterium]